MKTRRKARQGDILISDGLVYVYRGVTFRLQGEVTEATEERLGESLEFTLTSPTPSIIGECFKVTLNLSIESYAIDNPVPFDSLRMPTLLTLSTTS